MTPRPGDRVRITCEGVGPELRDALSEVFILREALKGAIIGNKIIRDQLAGSDDPLLRWVCRQAAHNMVCDQRSLDRSLADFPFGIAGRPLSDLKPLEPSSSFQGEGK